MTRGTPAERSACGAPTKSGAACRSWSLPGSTFCFSHDPAQVEHRRAARAKGGAAASTLRRLEGRRSRLDTPAALLRFVADLAHRAVAGELEPPVVNAAVYALSLQRHLIEASDHERRLRAIEERQGRARWRA